MEDKTYINELKIDSKLTYIRDTTYDGIIHAKQEGKKVAWAFGNLGVSHLLTSQGISMIGLGPNSSLNALRGGIKQVIPAAEAAGCSPEQCSMGKIAIGGCVLVAEGRGDEIQSDCRVPRADFAVLQSGCPVQIYIGHNIKQIYNIPVFELDTPLFYELPWVGNGRAEGPEWERTCRYVVEQLKDFIVFLEEMMGHSYDWDALRQELINVKKTSIIRKRILDKYGKAIPSPLSWFDMRHLQSLTSGLQKRSESEVLDFWESVEREVAERVRNGIGSVKNERFRLCWVGFEVYFKTEALKHFFASHGATIVTVDLMPNFYHDDVDPNHPLESLAREILLTREHAMPSEEFFLKRRLDQMKLVAPIHGIVFHLSRTCRAEAVHMLHRAEIFKEKTGIPCVCLDMDICDPQWYNDRQVESKIQTFLEILEGMKPWMPS